MAQQVGTSQLKTNRQNIIPVAAFLAIVIFIWSALIIAMPMPELAPAPRLQNEALLDFRESALDMQSTFDSQAIFDLRHTDFTNTIHTINNRDWNSWPERLYTPEDFENGIVGEPQSLTHEAFSRYNFFTHRVTLLLTPGITYGISMPSTEYAMRLFVDGEQAALIGLPSTTREENIARTSNNVVHFFVPQDERVDIIIQSSNFVHQFGGEPRTMHIGSIENIQQQQTLASMLIFLVAGSLLTSALYHLALVLMNRKRKAEFIFAICCFLGFMMAINPIPLFISEYNWSIMFRVEYLVFYGTFGMIGYLFATIMPQYAHKWLMRIYYVVCITLALTAIFLDTTVFTGFINFFYPVGMGMAIYGVIHLTLVLKDGKVQNFLAFMGFIIIVIFTANDVIYHARIPFLIEMRGFLPSWGVHFTAPIGIVFFVFCYALLLALRYADTERQAMEANMREEAIIMEANIREEAIIAEKAALENLSQVKTGFLQDIKHEIRNPLHVISLGMDYVNQYFEPKDNPDEAKQVLLTIQNEALRMGRMVEGMVEMANMAGSHTRRKKIDFAMLITTCADNYRLTLTNNHNTLQVKIADDLPFVYIESEQITRVIINLLSNANDSITDGEISVEAFSNNSYNIVHIRDNGSGIEPALMPRIFERGVSGKGHDGYGLAIAKTIVEAHGGTIRIESGKLRVESRNATIESIVEFVDGSMVTFTLPVYGGQDN